MQLQRMDDRVTVKREWFQDYRFHLLQRIDQLRKLVDICIERGLCSLDCETTGVDNRIYPDEYFEDGRTSRHGIRTVDKIVGLCISFDGENGYYIPLAHEPEDSENLPWDEAWDEITRLVNNCRIIFHGGKFDCEFLYPVTGKEYWKIDEYEDTLFMAKIINPLKSAPAGLKPLTKRLVGIEMVELDELFTEEKKAELKKQKRGYNFGLLHPKEGLEYGSSDGIFTYKDFELMRDRLSEGDMRLYNLEKAFCNVMRKMERNRVHIDVDRVNQLYTECKAALLKVGDLIREIVEDRTGQTGKWLTLNVGSPQQMSKALFTDQEGLKLKPTPEMVSDGQGGFGTTYDDSTSDDDDDDDNDPGKEKQWSVKDEVLKSLHRHYAEELSIQRDGVTNKDGKPRPESIFELILEYRHYDKMKGSYVEKIFKSHDKYGDVRPAFNQMGTDTTRLSCKAGKIPDGYSGVNFQGIPRDSDDDKPELFKQIRTIVIPRPGWILVKIDYSGEELRVVTNMSGDPVWTNSFINEDGDVHSITTRTLFGRDSITKDERNRGKRCNFAFIYGGGAGAISRNVGCSIEDGQRHMDNLRRDVPVLMGYVDHQKKFARQNKCIYTAFGRCIPIPTIDSPVRGIRAKAERCAINYTIQATSADVLKFAMCYMDKQIRERGWEDRVKYVLTVHDEVVYEIRPEYLMEIVALLDEWMTLPWKLPKAHGRQWTVPLETEPGIDVHWRARYDFFEMTRGTPVDPKDMAEDGTYTGKLKKGKYFADGRIYQEIPDFLNGHIRRLSAEEQPILEKDQLKQLPAGGDPAPEPQPAPDGACTGACTGP
jgi:DNA polymerase I-like protein with 3'-5' exonuclease and polymerase domains